jgi:hypothetical protein
MAGPMIDDSAAVRWWHKKAPRYATPAPGPSVLCFRVLSRKRKVAQITGCTPVFDALH